MYPEHNMERRRTSYAIFAVSVGLLFSSLFLLRGLYSLPVLDTFLWYAGVSLFFYIPGNLFLRLARFTNDDFFARLLLSVALGTALSPFLYSALRRIAQPEWLGIPAAIMLVAWAIVSARDIRRKGFHIRTSFPDLLAPLFLLSAVFALMHMSYFTDVILLRDGYKFRNVLTEGVMHLGIVNNLRETFPPVFPYASGYGFSNYHIYMHLQIEMFSRMFSINTVTLTFFYFPFLYCSLLVILPYMLIMEYWKKRTLGIVVGLMAFSSDLSFVPAWLGIIPKDSLWILTFAPTLANITDLNGIVASFFIMYLCVLFMKEYYEKGRLFDLVMFALLCYASFGFKGTMGAHIAAASVITGIASLFYGRQKKISIYFIIISIAVLAVIVLNLWFVRGGTGRIYSIELFEPLRQALKTFGIGHIPIVFCFVLLPVYLIACFGMKSAGFVLFKDVFWKKHFDPVVFFWLFFSLSGFLLPEIVYIPSPSSFLDNAANFFTIQSIVGSGMLLFYIFLKMEQSNKKVYMSLAVIVLLSLPSTMQYFKLRFNNSYYSVSSEAMEVVRYLEKTPPGSIILHPLNENGPSLSSHLSGRQSYITDFSGFTPDWIGDEAYARGIKTLFFFKGKDRDELRVSLLKENKINYVYAPIRYDEVLSRINVLSRIFQNREYVIYKVIGDKNHSAL